MLHHTRISTGCDDVTMLRPFFSTLRVRHIHVTTSHLAVSSNTHSNYYK